MTQTDQATTALPPVPLTVEGASVLHQMMRFNWAAWRALPWPEQEEYLKEMMLLLDEFEHHKSAVYSVLGHKGDLLFLHFRDNFEELAQTELLLARTKFSDYLQPVSSYLSIVELGLYESTSKTYASLCERGVQPHTPEWEQGIEEVLQRQREAMKARLFPEIPEAKYICFYPMDRKRGEAKNWYQVSMAERQRMMHEHGMIGRRYAGTVKQIISGSIGLDDWEWGVDLFADDPAVFKRLIYEMRFDEVSAVYALFGTFYVGLRYRAEDFRGLLNGK